MKNKAYRIISIAFLAVMLVLSGCAKLSQVSVTSFTLDSVNPKGLRSLSLTASVGVHNPASEITLSEISGEVIISPGERLSFLQQDHFKYDEYPVLDTVIMGNARLYEIMKEKDALYAKEDFSEEDQY